MQRGYKIRLYPNNKQLSKLESSASAARYVYNWTLNYQREFYKENGKFVYNNDIRKKITELKQTEELSWLYEYSNNIAKQAVKDCEKAFMNFFKGLAKYPKFKSKKKSKPKFYCDGHKTKIKDRRVLIEKVGWIKLAEKNYLPDEFKLLSATVSKQNGIWYISFMCEIESEEVPKNTGRKLGIDVGIKNLITLSDGTVYRNINKDNKFRKKAKRHKRLQRKYDKKIKGGVTKTKSAAKLKKSLEKLEFRINNIKKDYIHKITTEIVKTKRPAFIVIENLNIKGMLKNKKLARAIYELSLYEIFRQLKYKSEWYGSTVIEAGRFYPSSKMCCKCGNINRELKLSDRIYKCSCGNVMDRDENAAHNLEALAG